MNEETPKIINSELEQILHNLSSIEKECYNLKGIKDRLGYLSIPKSESDELDLVKSTEPNCVLSKIQSLKTYSHRLLGNLQQIRQEFEELI